MTSYQLIGTISNGGRRTNVQEALDHFNAVADKIRQDPEAIVYNAAEYQDSKKDWEEYMVESFDALVNDEPIVVLLDGWEESQGARFEERWARYKGYKVITEGEL